MDEEPLPMAIQDEPNIRFDTWTSRMDSNNKRKIIVFLFEEIHRHPPQVRSSVVGWETFLDWKFLEWKVPFVSIRFVSTSRLSWWMTRSKRSSTQPITCSPIDYKLCVEIQIVYNLHRFVLMSITNRTHSDMFKHWRVFVKEATIEEHALLDKRETNSHTCMTAWPLTFSF